MIISVTFWTFLVFRRSINNAFPPPVCNLSVPDRGGLLTHWSKCVFYSQVTLWQSSRGSGGGDGASSKMSPVPAASLASTVSTLQEQNRLLTHPPPLQHTPPLVLSVQLSFLTAQEFKGGFEPTQSTLSSAPPHPTHPSTSPIPATQRCFCAEISRWGAVCVWGQTCPSFDIRADSDSDWAADQDHSLSSPLLPPQSSPTHDMCHCHRSAPEDTTSWRSGQIPKAGKQKGGEGNNTRTPLSLQFLLMDYFKSSFFLNT